MNDRDSRPYRVVIPNERPRPLRAEKGDGDRVWIHATDLRKRVAPRKVLELHPSLPTIIGTNASQVNSHESISTANIKVNREPFWSIGNGENDRLSIYGRMRRDRWKSAELKSIFLTQTLHRCAWQRHNMRRFAAVRWRQRRHKIYITKRMRGCAKPF
jgi:hypothetical protein